jgi:hypothetical protein
MKRGLIVLARLNSLEFKTPHPRRDFMSTREAPKMESVVVYFSLFALLNLVALMFTQVHI